MRLKILGTYVFFHAEFMAGTETRIVKKKQMAYNIGMRLALLKKRWVFVSVLLLLLCLCVGLFAYRTSHHIRLACYQVPAELCSVLVNQIRHAVGKRFRVSLSVLPDAEPPLPATVKKYDMLLLWNGRNSQLLAPHALELPEQCTAEIPRAIRQIAFVGGRHVQLPLLLDHYGFDSLAENQDGLLLPGVENFSDFASYFAALKKLVPYPFLCAGKDDRTLLAMVSVLVESLAGADGYNNLVSILKTTENVEAKLAAPFGHDSAGRELSLLHVLDMLSEWMASDLIHPKWHLASAGDVDSFMKDQLAGAVVMALSAHRRIVLRTVVRYRTERFPVFLDSAAVSHGVVAPCMVAMFFKKQSRLNGFAHVLMSAEKQEELSELTKLAPVAATCSAYDRLSDDVRFYAASVPAGPLSDLYYAAFLTPQAAAEFCAVLRNRLAER